MDCLAAVGLAAIHGAVSFEASHDDEHLEVESLLAQNTAEMASAALAALELGESVRAGVWLPECDNAREKTCL